MPLFAWSSQATGFFSGRYKPEDRDKTGLEKIARTWFNDANFRRLERARELAGRKGVTPGQVALAWVLCQPFPTFALVGPQTIDELNDLLPALAGRAQRRRDEVAEPRGIDRPRPLLGPRPNTRRRLNTPAGGKSDGLIALRRRRRRPRLRQAIQCLLASAAACSIDANIARASSALRRSSRRGR